MAGFEVLAVWGTIDHGGVVVTESEVLAVWGTVDHGGVWWQDVRQLVTLRCSDHFLHFLSPGLHPVEWCPPHVRWVFSLSPI